MTKVPFSEKFSFTNGRNAKFIENLYAAYEADPDSVDPTWRRFFEGYEFALSHFSSSDQADASVDQIKLESKVEAYITLYRKIGHLYSRVNPLGFENKARQELSLEANDLSFVEPDQVFYPANLPQKNGVKFSEILSLLQSTYCESIGADFRDVGSVEAVDWFQHTMEENRNKPFVSPDQQLRILQKLIESEGFERFLHDRYLGQKRFSLEGLESLIPLLDIIVDKSGTSGVEEICLGMAHRGRLNVLANFMGKPYATMLKEFEGTEASNFDIDGDVKYHMGFVNKIRTASDQELRVYLAPNPSHLEAVNPVVEGFVRARQELINDECQSKIVPILIHGDAAFVGQGIVAETINLSELDAYKTGGTIHIITNNQVGFTTDPKDSRSCDYSSDVAKLVHAPVLHVNADDPEAVIWCGLLATMYRQKFKKDVVIDLIGYRRHGHNETDEPGFTQPLLYSVIKSHKTTLELYSQKLIAAGIVESEQFEGMKKAFRATLQTNMEKVRNENLSVIHKIPKEFERSVLLVKATEKDMFTSVKTAMPSKELKKIAGKITQVPSDFGAHPKIAKLFKSREAMTGGDGKLDWGMAELLTYGSLAWDGMDVRLSGQDCQRGTFSHRHAVINSRESGESYSVFDNLSETQGKVSIVNSPLSEAGVLGFEFGYSVAHPDALVLWEAQFGDFCNGAQIVIDQFLSSSEAKWKQACGLVLLLPHGYEGAGPEHSSARPERFLQLCGNNNMQVANLTQPSQLFHILRRQMLRKFRKPLIVLTPKSLLRHPKVVSKWEDFSKGSFSPVIDDPVVKKKEAVRRIVFCSGKIYYELDQVRSDHGNLQDNVAIIRIEQLYPFPEEATRIVMDSYPNAEQILWSQEEPSNMGAWTFIRHRIKKLALRRSTFRYSGRKGAGTTAEGSLKSHQKEQQRIIQDSLGLTQEAHSDSAKASARG